MGMEQKTARHSLIPFSVSMADRRIRIYTARVAPIQFACYNEYVWMSNNGVWYKYITFNVQTTRLFVSYLLLHYGFVFVLILVSWLIQTSVSHKTIQYEIHDYVYHLAECVIYWKLKLKWDFNFRYRSKTCFSVFACWFSFEFRTFSVCSPNTQPNYFPMKILMNKNFQNFWVNQKFANINVNLYIFLRCKKKTETILEVTKKKLITYVLLFVIIMFAWIILCPLCNSFS